MINFKHQIIVVHGGDAFDSYQDYLKFLNQWQIDFNKFKADTKEWKKSLTIDLGVNYEVILPEMPNKRNAKYNEWKIWFEKFIPFLDLEIVLVGHSLGGTFLAKYLAENKFPKTIKALFLVAPMYNAEGTDESMGDFVIPDSLANLGSRTNRIFIYHSQDDPVVPFKNLSKFEKQLPKATIRIFTDRGHFNQEHLPELAEDIKALF